MQTYELNKDEKGYYLVDTNTGEAVLNEKGGIRHWSTVGRTNRYCHSTLRGRMVKPITEEQLSSSVSHEENIEVRYPGIRVSLLGLNDNSFAIISTVVKALRENGVESPEIVEFRREATAGNREHMLMVCQHWVTIF